MILSQLYPTALTLSGDSLTAQIPDIPINTEAFTPAYWLGWIARDDIPAAFVLSSVERGSDYITLTPKIPDYNMDFGYAALRAGTSAPANNYYPYFLSYNGAKWAGDVGRSDVRLINNMEIAKSSRGIVAWLTVIRDDNNVGYDATLRYNNSELDSTNWIRWANGNITAIISCSLGTADIMASDFDDEGFAHIEIGGVQCTVAIRAYRISIRRDRYEDSAVGDYVAPAGIISQIIDGVQYVQSAESHTYNQTETPSTDPKVPSNGLSLSDWSFSGAWGVMRSGLVAGGFDVTLTRDDVDAMTSSRYYLRGNAIIYKYSSSRVWMQRAYTPADIKRHLALMPRITDGSVYGFGPDIYVPLFTANDQFTGDFVSGALEDIRSQLRPWQYTNITDNTYTEDDKPTPEPTPEDDTINIGSSITRPTTLGVGGTNGFITQYVLSATQIAQIGKNLWTSFIDPDYWRNYMFTLALDTGSFNLSALLDFFVSLRVYPFPLINVPSYAATGNNKIFVGAGKIPLTIGSTSLHTINNYADYVDAGTCTIYSSNFHGDFRDFSDVEISLYLPYCGTVQLNPGDVVGTTLHAQYAVDFATGGCIAYVDVLTQEGLQYPIAALPGQIGADVPLTATNAGQVAARLAGDVINVASLIGGGVSNQLSARAGAAAQVLTGGAAMAPQGIAGSMGTIMGGTADTALNLAQMATNALSRPAIGIPMLSGGRGFGSFGAPQTAYVQIRRAIYKQPATYAHTLGLQASQSKTLASMSGLVAGLVDTSGLRCTAAEAQEIVKIIAAGIII